MLACKTCGAAVLDGELHKSWHRDQEHAVQKAAITAPCRRCGGSGRAPGLFNSCIRCGGSGEEPSR